MAENKDQSTPKLQAEVRHSLRNLAFENRQNYGGFRTSPADRFQFQRFGRILEVNHESNTVTVVWIDQMGIRSDIPITHPYAGQRGHILAMPEINSIVIVGFTSAIRPYILRYLPFNYPLMVELTQFPERVVDVNFSIEQHIKTHVELREDFDITSIDPKTIQNIKEIEIKTRVAESRLEEYAISKPLLEPGEISIASKDGSEIRWDRDLTLTDMNQDEIKLQAEDNSIHITSMHLLTSNEFGRTIEGQIRRPFSFIDKKTKTDPFKKDGKSTPLDAVADPILDRLMIPIGRNGKLDLTDDQNKGNEYELVYQFKVNSQAPFVERLVSCNEYSDNSLNSTGEGNFIALPEDEQFTVVKGKIERSDAADGTVKFNIKQEDKEIKHIKDTNPFRPIELRYATKRGKDGQAPLREDSLFNHLNNLLGFDKDFFGQLYQDIVESSMTAPLRQKQLELNKLREEVDAKVEDDTVQDIKGELPAEKTPLEEEMANFRNKLKKRIAGQQLGLLLDDDVINQSFGSVDELKKAAGQGNNDSFLPVGPLFRFNTGTLVDGHDRMIKDPFSFERISLQLRHQSGMFMNVDRRGSVNLNMTNLLMNTVGMSFYSGFVHRRICETKVAEKYKPEDKVKIYLPEPIPTDTKSDAGRVLNIPQKDKSTGSDPRDRKDPHKGIKQGHPEQFVRANEDLGQIPSLPKAHLPPPEDPAMTEEGEPITFLNELQIKIPKEAKIKPCNDLMDPSIMGYDAPRTKELDFYSYQVDKRLNEKDNPELAGEMADFDKMDKGSPFIEITAANLIDRDGTIIRDSMTQKPLAFDFSINVEGKAATQGIDHEGNLDTTYNNIYHAFNSGFFELGMAYKVTQKDEEVEVRLEAEDKGKKPKSDDPNDVAVKEECKKDKVKRKAYTREAYHHLGHITFKVDAKSEEGVRTEVKTPKEIEKEETHKKVEDRELRAPKENTLDDPDLELNMGGVVDNNHTEAVQEAIGFSNKRLHYRVKKKVKEEIDISEFQGALDKIAAGDKGGVAELKAKLTAKANDPDISPEEFIDLCLALIDALDKLVDGIIGPQEEDPAEGKDGKEHADQFVFNTIDDTVSIEEKKKAEEERRELERKKLEAYEEAKKAVTEIWEEFAGENGGSFDLPIGNKAETNQVPADFFEAPAMDEEPPINGITFPIGFGGQPGADVQVGTSVVQPGGGDSTAPDPRGIGGSVYSGQDPHFPDGAVLGNDGRIIFGQGNFVGGSAAHPRTGEIFNGAAYGSGVTIDADGRLVGPARFPILNQISPMGTVVPMPVRVPMGTVVGPKGVLSSMPSPGQPGDPNANDPIDRAFFGLEPRVENYSGVDLALLRSAPSSHAGSTTSAQGTRSNPPGFAPPATPNASNREMFPDANTPKEADGSGAAAGAGAGKTNVEIDQAGDWACKSDIPGVNQTIINPQAQLQLGRVIDKDEENGITAATSVLGPRSLARLSLKNETGLDLDAAGNWIGYATHDFLLKANRAGEVRTYDDMHIISDKRSLVFQAEGGDPLEDGDVGTMEGGLRARPTAEFVLGRLEVREGENEGKPIQNLFKNNINIAMIRHIDENNRTAASIDEDGNYIVESTQSHRLITMRTPLAKLALDNVQEVIDGEALPVQGVFGQDLAMQLQAASANGERNTELDFDNDGNMIGLATNNIQIAAERNVDILSNTRSVYITATGDGAGDTVVQFAIGRLRQLGDFTYDGPYEPSLYDNQIISRLRAFGDITAGNFDRQVEVDSAGNYIVFVDNPGRINMITSPEAELQIGRVVNTPPANVPAAPVNQNGYFERPLRALLRQKAAPNNSELGFDDIGNGALAAQNPNATLLLKTPAAELQLGRVANMAVAGRPNVPSPIAGGGNVKLQLMVGAAILNIDEAGNFILEGPGQLFVQTTGNVNINSNGSATINARNNVDIVSPLGPINVTGNTNVNLTANNIIATANTTANITVANGDANITATNGNANITAANGDANVTANRVIATATTLAEVVVTAGDANIAANNVNATATTRAHVIAINGNVDVDAGNGNVNLNANPITGDINLNASKVRFNGTVKFP